VWKKLIEMFLKFKKCDKVIKRKKIETDKADWDENDPRAVNYIS
jgi:hypothetical protein